MNRFELWDKVARNSQCLLPQPFHGVTEDMRSCYLCWQDVLFQNRFTWTVANVVFVCDDNDDDDDDDYTNVCKVHSH